MQYAHARHRRRSCATPPTSASRRERRLRPGAARPRDARATCCGALGEFPRVVASAAELREPHRVARYLEDIAGALPPLLRRLPGAAAWATRSPSDLHRRPAAARRGHPDRARQRPRPARRLRPRADVTATAMPTHEAGWAHADGALRGPALAARARRRQRAGRRAVVDDRAQGRRRRARGRRGRRCPTWSPSTAPRRTSSTRPTSGPGPAPSARRSPAYDVYYAGKAFLCTTVARWVAEEGLQPRRLLRRRAGRRAAGRLPTRRGSASTATTRPIAELRARRRRRRRPDHRRLVRRDRAAGRGRRASSAYAPPVHGPGDRRRRGAHPRVHRHRPRGPEVRLLAHRRRRRSRPYGACSPRPALELLGLHSHIGSQIFDTVRLRGRRPPGARRCTPRSRDELGVELPELDLGGGFGIAYTTAGRPVRPGAAGHRDDQDRRARVPRARHRRAAAVDRARPRDRRAGDVHRLRGRHGQGGRARRRRRAHLRLASTAG